MEDTRTNKKDQAQQNHQEHLILNILLFLQRDLKSHFAHHRDARTSVERFLYMEKQEYILRTYKMCWWNKPSHFADIIFPGLEKNKSHTGRKLLTCWYPKMLQHVGARGSGTALTPEPLPLLLYINHQPLQKYDLVCMKSQTESLLRRFWIFLTDTKQYVRWLFVFRAKLRVNVSGSQHWW